MNHSAATALVLALALVHPVGKNVPAAPAEVRKSARIVGSIRMDDLPPVKEDLHPARDPRNAGIQIGTARHRELLRSIDDYERRKHGYYPKR